MAEAFLSFNKLKLNLILIYDLLTFLKFGLQNWRNGKGARKPRID